MILDVDDVVVNTFSWVTQEPQERKLQTKGTLNPKKTSPSEKIYRIVHSTNRAILEINRF